MVPAGTNPSRPYGLCELPVACSDNSINMISFFTMMNIFNFYD